MTSLNAVLIDCGLWELIKTLHLEMGLDESAVKRIQKKLANSVLEELVDKGVSVVEDFTPRV